MTTTSPRCSAASPKQPRESLDPGGALGGEQQRPALLIGPLLNLQRLLLPRLGRSVIGGAPEGYDALLLGRLAAALPAVRHAELLHVVRDDARMAQLADGLRFFAPSVEVLTFPAWDCLPYDRVSPHRDLVSKRIDTLTQLLAPRPDARPRLVIATVAAILQRVPPRAAYGEAILAISRGQALSPAALIEFVAHNGYIRAETVRESGEFAVRGGIIDLFPPGASAPLRVDFFGDEIEESRSFDPMSQRSAGRLDGFVLKPVSEVTLDPASINRFRTGYRERFGAVGEDPLYEAISAGRLYAGMEHWLPLFFPGLETLFDYLPDSAVTIDHQGEEAASARFELIADFYRARTDLQRAEAASGAAYRPLPPELLYLVPDEWSGRVEGRAGGVLSPFGAPEGGRAVDGGGRPGRTFGPERAQPGTSL